MFFVRLQLLKKQPMKKFILLTFIISAAFSTLEGFAQQQPSRFIYEAEIVLNPATGTYVVRQPRQNIIVDTHVITPVVTPTRTTMYVQNVEHITIPRYTVPTPSTAPTTPIVISDTFFKYFSGK
jgi:hypothetical protein